MLTKHLNINWVPIWEKKKSFHVLLSYNTDQAEFKLYLVDFKLN